MIKFSYILAPYVAIIIFLTSCAQDDVGKVVLAAEGGAVATGLSGGNIIFGLLMFVLLLAIIFGQG